MDKDELMHEIEKTIDSLQPPKGFEGGLAMAYYRGTREAERAVWKVLKEYTP